MICKRSFFFLIISIAFASGSMGVARADSKEAAGAYVASVGNSGADQYVSGDETSCVGLREERERSCSQAAEICRSVYDYDSYNKIKPCALFSQRCSELGQQENTVCYEKNGSRQWSLWKSQGGI